MHSQRRHRGQQRDEQRRLGGKQEIEGDAGAEQHRQPQEPALLLGLELAGEGGEERQATWTLQGEAAGIAQPRFCSADLRHRACPSPQASRCGRARSSGGRPAHGSHGRQERDRAIETAVIPAPRVPDRARAGPGRDPCTAQQVVLVSACLAREPQSWRLSTRRLVSQCCSQEQAASCLVSRPGPARRAYARASGAGMTKNGGLTPSRHPTPSPRCRAGRRCG